MVTFKHSKELATAQEGYFRKLVETLEAKTNRTAQENHELDSAKKELEKLNEKSK